MVLGCRLCLAALEINHRNEARLANLVQLKTQYLLFSGLAEHQGPAIDLTALQQAGMTGLNDNQRISFEMVKDRQGKLSAGNLELINA